MEWLIATKWGLVLPLFLIGLTLHKFGRTNAAVGFWVITIMIGLNSIADAPLQIAHFIDIPESNFLWAEIALIFFTGFLCFPVLRFFFSNSSVLSFFYPKK
ncbi:MAG: hypothetical protein QM496_08515 [Verrucomicrobiota bacterium]